MGKNASKLKKKSSINIKKSLGLRSGSYGGWSNNSTFSSIKYSLVFRAVCELALS
ncbi:unnamed protein product [Acanthoscelides obtectus]|uniref:Uncharacterized protein n=1 Tax=Acanthoscelides obtectus TaxID=200917 RepID=A0A9P0JLP7_ACAOB|nr:unnamed protein product [Acanthoscelides obtectus]CAK1634604.1 hypothetical protein AOBTE_LOCUS8827 [Acanthoscelides obtectus]